MLPVIAGSIFTSGFFASVRIFLLSMVLSIAPMLVKGLLTALGIGFLTYQGVDLMLENSMDLVFAKYDNIPAELRTNLELMGVLNALNILVSGMTSALAIKGISSFTRWKFSRPGSFTA